MTRRKPKWYEEPKKITATIACIAALCGAIVVVANYINLPKRVEANEGQLKSVNEYIAEQRIQNDLLREIQQQQMQQHQWQRPYYEPPEYNQPVYENPKPRCWDEYEQWYYDCSTGEWL